MFFVPYHFALAHKSVYEKNILFYHGKQSNLDQVLLGRIIGEWYATAQLLALISMSLYYNKRLMASNWSNNNI